MSGNPNIKSNLMGNLRNMSVPRGSQQKSYMLSSQDYAQGAAGAGNAYYDKHGQRTEKLAYAR